MKKKWSIEVEWNDDYTSTSPKLDLAKFLEVFGNFHFTKVEAKEE